MLSDVFVLIVHRNQVVRITDGHYLHPECYTCPDCGLNLRMRGHFWAGNVMYCEKHAKDRYQGPGSSLLAPCQWASVLASPSSQPLHICPTVDEECCFSVWNFSFDSFTYFGHCMGFDNRLMNFITFNHILQYCDIPSCFICKCMLFVDVCFEQLGYFVLHGLIFS